MKWKVKRLCFDSTIGVPPYEEVFVEEFENFEDAWEFALEYANQETDYLNQDCDEGISFGIPEDTEFEKKQIIKVQYYYHPENNTEEVTHYWVYMEKSFNGNEKKRTIKWRCYND